MNVGADWVLLLWVTAAGGRVLFGDVGPHSLLVGEGRGLQRDGGGRSHRGGGSQ
jgi:hypothetical protein